MAKINSVIIAVFVTVILINISIVSCEYKAPEPAYKSDTILPSITTTGANTFGCKLNGSYWLAVPKKDFQASYSKGGVSITFDMSGNNQWASIVIASSKNQIFGTGKYYFSKKMHGNYFETGKIYRTSDSTMFGYLNILRLDSINRIISGTFEFKPENSALTPSSVLITEGRFDLKY